MWRNEYDRIYTNDNLDNQCHYLSLHRKKKRYKAEFTAKPYCAFFRPFRHPISLYCKVRKIGESRLKQAHKTKPLLFLPVQEETVIQVASLIGLQVN